MDEYMALENSFISNKYDTQNPTDYEKKLMLKYNITFKDVKNLIKELDYDENNETGDFPPSNYDISRILNKYFDDVYKNTIKYGTEKEFKYYIDEQKQRIQEYEKQRKKLRSENSLKKNSDSLDYHKGQIKDLQDDLKELLKRQKKFNI